MCSVAMRRLTLDKLPAALALRVVFSWRDRGHSHVNDSTARAAATVIPCTLSMYVCLSVCQSVQC
jgi:hypothetical protein